MTGKVCLIGYRGLRHAKFFKLLEQAEVTYLLDVRRNPYSPNPDYQKRSINLAAKDYAVKYFHVPVLGVPGAGNSPIPEGEPSTLDEQLATNEAKTALQKIITLISRGESVALMCSEPDYRECHRPKLIALLKDLEPSLELKELTGSLGKTLFDLS